MKKQISVIGLGYVGLPLAIAIVKSGYKVIGIDNDERKIADLNSGISIIQEVSSKLLKKIIKKGKITFSNDFSRITDSEIILICVPTPLDNVGHPDLSLVVNAAEKVSKYVSSETLIILESTVAPGDTRNIILPIFDKHTRVGVTNLKFAFSPERIDPGNNFWSVSNTPKIVAGQNDEACDAALEFYSKFIKKVIKCTSFEAAETAKLLENSYRLINISFINEMSNFCRELEIDVNEVINAAASKPYGFMPFFPSVGVGGHCIPVDSIYLAKKAQEINAPIKLIELASQINKSIPQYYVELVGNKLKNLKNKRILVVGVSYKPNIADTRETAVEKLIVGLRVNGAVVSWHDEIVKEWNGEKSSPLSSNYDLAILATPHDYLDLAKLGNVPVLNTRGSIW